MDLDEFLWREKETGRNFSIRVGCTEQTVLKVKNRKGSPKLALALKIVEATGGKVTIQELLCEEDDEKIKKEVCS